MTGRSTRSGRSSSSTLAKNASMSTCSTVASELSTSGADTCRAPCPPFTVTAPFSRAGPTDGRARSEPLDHLELERGRGQRMRVGAPRRDEPAALVGDPRTRVELVHLEPEGGRGPPGPLLDALEQCVRDPGGPPPEARSDVDGDERRAVPRGDAGHGADPPAIVRDGGELHRPVAAGGPLPPVRLGSPQRLLERLQVGDRGVLQHLQAQGPHVLPIVLRGRPDGEGPAHGSTGRARRSTAEPNAVGTARASGTTPPRSGESASRTSPSVRSRWARAVRRQLRS